MNTNCLSEYDSERNQREWELAKQRGEANRLNLERKEQPKIESYIHKDDIEEFEREKQLEIQRVKIRQRSLDSMNCETYAKNNTADQQIKVMPQSSFGLALLDSLAQGNMIAQNRQAWYESCMKRLGY